jgi:hypothetical protein
MKVKWSRGAVFAVFAVALTGALVVACGGGTSASNDNASTSQQTAAPAAAQVSPNLFLTVDTVRGSTGLSDDEKPRKSCVQASRIPIGGQVVWRIKVLDPRTGKEMSDQNLTSVVVKLSDGQTFAAKYGGHPSSAPVDYFWATSWKVPADYPTGSVDYTVVATDKEGRTGEWHQLKVASAMLQIVATDPLALTNSIGDPMAVAR